MKSQRWFAWVGRYCFDLLEERDLLHYFGSLEYFVLIRYSDSIGSEQKLQSMRKRNFALNVKIQNLEYGIW